MLEPSGTFTTPTFIELFCGIGGFAIGFQEQGFTCRGAIDYDEQCCRDHQTLSGSPAWHADIRGLTPADLLRYVGMEAPDVVCLSPPCQGFSGCLPRVMADKDKYKALNSLSFFGVWLVLNTWGERPPPMIIMENVPRAAKSDWMDDVVELLESHHYRVVRHSHNCGEIGPIAQNRRRMLLLARHERQIPDSCPVYLPPNHEPLTVGEVISRLPVPTPRAKGAPKTMHDLPLLSAQNWLRLAAVEAGKDHKSIPPLILQSGQALAPQLTCTPRNGVFGVQAWDNTSPTVIACADIHAGAYSLGDQRLEHNCFNGAMEVQREDAPAKTVIGESRSYKGANVRDVRVQQGQWSPGRYPGGWGVLGMGRPSFTVRACHAPQIAHASVGDNRLAYTPGQSGRYSVERHDVPSHTVTANTRVGQNWSSAAADPRLPPSPLRHDGKYGVNPMDVAARTILARAEPTTSCASVSDQRLPERATRYNGYFGVNPWEEAAHTVVAAATPGRTWSSACDARGWPLPTHHLTLPATNEGKVQLPVLHGPALDLESKAAIYLVIRAPDDTWHRPLTPLELFVIQGFSPYDAQGNMVKLDGENSQRWKKAIGNAVPPPAAAAIARECKRTLVAAGAGGLLLSGGGERVWVEGMDNTNIWSGVGSSVAG